MILQENTSKSFPICWKSHPPLLPIAVSVLQVAAATEWGGLEVTGGPTQGSEAPETGWKSRRSRGIRSTGGKAVPTAANTLQGPASLFMKSACPQANVLSLAGRVEGLAPSRTEREVKVAA